MPQKKEQREDWTDSERAALDALIEEREREQWLKERRATFLASAKGAFQWLTAAALAWSVVRDLGSVAWKWLRHTLGV